MALFCLEPGEFSRILEDYERKTGKLDSAPEDRGQRLQGQGEQVIFIYKLQFLCVNFF